MFADAVALLLQIFLFASLLALVVERLTEHFVKPPLSRAGQKQFAPYFALALGLFISWAFGVDLFTPLALEVGLQPFVPWVGYLLTGLLVGGGSNFLHDVWPTGQRQHAS